MTCAKNGTLRPLGLLHDKGINPHTVVKCTMGNVFGARPDSGGLVLGGRLRSSALFIAMLPLCAPHTVKVTFTVWVFRIECKSLDSGLGNFPK